MATALRWTGDPDLRFAHVPYGMYVIEQRARRYYLSLALAGVALNTPDQDLGSFKTSAMARREAATAHRVLSKLDV